MTRTIIGGVVLYFCAYFIKIMHITLATYWKISLDMFFKILGRGRRAMSTLKRLCKSNLTLQFNYC